MKEINELYRELEEAFPSCIFTNRSNKIILNDGSFHNDMSAIMMDKIGGGLYDLGVLKEIADFVREKEFDLSYETGEVLIVKP